MLFNILFFASVICSLLSQLPQLLATGTDVYLKLIWILPLTYGVFKERRHLLDFELKPFYLFAIIFFSYCFILETLIFNYRGYFGQDCYNIGVSFMVMMVSYIYWQQIKPQLSKKIIKSLSICILACTFFLCVTIYFDFLRGTDLSGRIYAFQAKNSMGQILLVGLIVGIFFSWPRNKIIQIGYIFIILAITFVIFALKSRATLISLCFVIGYFILYYKNNKIRNLLILSIFAILSYLFIFSDLGVYIYDNFILAGREVNNIDDLSSGRFSVIERKLGWIENSWIGAGNTYIDCFPVATYVQYGIIGCLIMGLFLLFLTNFIFHLNLNIPINAITTVLYISFIVNCLFEAFPPFGPGVKCFLLWVFIGFSLAIERNGRLIYEH